MRITTNNICVFSSNWRNVSANWERTEIGLWVLSNNLTRIIVSQAKWGKKNKDESKRATHDDWRENTVSRIKIYIRTHIHWTFYIIHLSINPSYTCKPDAIHRFPIALIESISIYKMTPSSNFYISNYLYCIMSVCVSRRCVVYPYAGCPNLFLSLSLIHPRINATHLFCCVRTKINATWPKATQRENVRWEHEKRNRLSRSQIGT